MCNYTIPKIIQKKTAYNNNNNNTFIKITYTHLLLLQNTI